MESALHFTDPGHTRTVDVPASLAVDVATVQRRLQAGNGGYEIVHASPGLEVGVYVLVAPEPDRQQSHADDELPPLRRIAAMAVDWDWSWIVFDHVKIVVRDAQASLRFYKTVLEPLDIPPRAEACCGKSAPGLSVGPDATGHSRPYGRDNGFFPRGGTA